MASRVANRGWDYDSSDLGLLDRTPSRDVDAKDIYLAGAQAVSQAKLLHNFPRSIIASREAALGAAIRDTKPSNEWVILNELECHIPEVEGFFPGSICDAVVDYAQIEGALSRISASNRDRLTVRDLIGEICAVVFRAEGESIVFWKDAVGLDRRGDRIGALDLVYDRIDDGLMAGEFQAIDREIDSMSVEGASPSLMLAVLTATLPARSKLESRQRLLECVRQELSRQGEDVGILLAGLE